MLKLGWRLQSHIDSWKMNEDHIVEVGGGPAVSDREAQIDRLNTIVHMADGTISSLSTVSIYRIPMSIRDVNSTDYEPQVLSLGPYHHGRPRFQAMDEFKGCYFKSFLDRNPNKNLGDYLRAVQDRKDEARNAYSKPYVDSENLEASTKFVELMLLDCCFVLEFLLINTESWRQGASERGREIINPILNSAWALPLVLRDMLLLENQLPFYLLKRLLELNIPNQTPSLTQIVLDMFSDLMPGKIRTPPTDTEGSTVIHHILHLMYSCIIPPPLPESGPPPSSSPESRPLSCCFKMFQHRARLVQRQVQSCYLSGNAIPAANDEQLVQTTISDVPASISEPPGLALSEPSAPASMSRPPSDITNPQEPTVRWIPCAKRLREAGVVFRSKTNYESFLEVTFDRGTMEIPPLQIFGYVSSIFNNLIAFEQCYTHNRGPFYLTSYASLMNFVIDTAADVELLQQGRIITSTLGCDKDIATLFNQLGKNAAIDNENHLARVFAGINNHRDKRMNRWKAMLNHKYFGNPWAIISVAAASILLALTFLQTLFTILTYYR